MFFVTLIGSGNSVILGGGIGFLLAMANFSLSIFLSSKALTTSLIKSEIIILFGFLLRLTALGFIFYCLSRIPALNIVALLFSFLIGFTVLLVIEVQLLMKVKFSN